MNTEARHFGPYDDLMVHLSTPDTVQFTTRGHDSEELPLGDVRKLIEYLQEIVGDDGPELSLEELDAMPLGAKVVDPDGDEWTKEDAGWRWRKGHWPSVEFVNIFGPVRAVREVGSAAHTDT